MADPKLEHFPRTFDKVESLQSRLSEVEARVGELERNTGSVFVGKETKLGSICEGFGIINIVDGRRVIGELRCNGICKDGTRCRPVSNADGTRWWCGCPNEPEPTECHLVKLKLPSGEWAFDCACACPQPQDMCTPQSRKDGETRIIVQCECLTPGG
jgi:hypothetical protein